VWIGRHFADDTHIPPDIPETLISREALPIRLPTRLCGHSAPRDCHTGVPEIRKGQANGTGTRRQYRAQPK
jgi:hypothetical protein